MRLLEGSSALLGLHIPQGHTGRLDVQGGLPVRLIELNEHDEVIGDRIVAAGTRAILAGETTHTALCGMGASSAGSRVVGWQRDTSLTQVGRYSFVGDGFTVRPQVPPLWRENGRYVKHGLMEVAHVLRGNTVQVRGESVPGWLETVLAGPVGSVAIAVRAENVEQARSLQVRLAWLAQAWSPVYDAAAEAATVVDAEGGAILHFNAPQAPAGAKWLGVLVSGPLTPSLEGVWGLADEVSQLHAQWSSLRAPAAGIALEDEEPAWSNAVVAVDTPADEPALFASAGHERTRS